jgi:hypothetical protein
MVRHLLYHVYPVAGNGVWRWNLDNLIKRLPLFDGVRAAAVATNPPGKMGEFTSNTIGHTPYGNYIPDYTDSAEEVVELLRPHGFKFHVTRNDANLREVKTFEPLFYNVMNYRGNDMTLYAHAKGVCRPFGDIVMTWTRVLYEAMLDYWPVVENSLCSHPVAGCFKKVGMGWPATQSLSTWHYSGSWFWFRNADLFAKNWRRIDKFWSGIEPYPSLHFSESEAGVVFGQGTIETLNLYNPATWTRIGSEWEQWKQENMKNRSLITL